MSISCDGGSAKSNYTATKRLGNDQSCLSEIPGGKWKVVRDYGKRFVVQGNAGLLANRRCAFA